MKLLSPQNLIPFLLTALTFSNCSTYKISKSVVNNDYYNAFKLIPEASRMGFNSTPDSFLEWSLKKTLQEAEKAFKDRPVLSKLPKLRLHGMLTPYNFKIRDNYPIVFTRTENSFDGNPVWDIISAEVSALMAAKYFRFDSYKRGSCLRAYQSQMNGLMKKHQLPNLIIPSDLGGEALSEDQKSSTPEIDPELFATIKKAFSRDIVRRQSLPNPAHPEGEKIKLLRLDDESLWRLAPLPYLESCSDFRKTLNLYSSKTKIHCIKNTLGKNFLLEEVNTSDRYFTLKDFVDSSQLEPIVNSMCNQIAFRHSLQLSQEDRQKLFLLITKNPGLPGWYMNFVDKHSDEILDAYRASLLL
ncbi:hypothetical protein GW915_07555 [bacterium]|nr:hypothetical protein [bacterium]